MEERKTQIGQVWAGLMTLGLGKTWPGSEFGSRMLGLWASVSTSSIISTAHKNKIISRSCKIQSVGCTS